MPVSRKDKSPKVAVVPAPAPFPRRVVVVPVVRDESGSMAHWRQKQGEFIPAVGASLIEVGGPKVGQLVYIINVVISGGVAMTEFEPLGQATDPEYTPDGQTPIGTALKAVAEKCEEFFETKIFPEEVTVKNFEVLIDSDLKPTGETAEQTEEGIRAFTAMCAKYRGKVNLVGPAPEAMNDELAARLDLNERGVKFLDADPKSILKITLDSLLNASRTSLGGSNPSIRIS